MPLEPITVLDNDEAALSNRQALFIDRNTAAHLGHDTLQAIREGSYRLKDGTEVDWSAAVAAAVDPKATIPPDMQLPAAIAGRWPTTSLTVANTTTLRAAERLVDEGARPLVLNMANGISPGGGFLSGARAQEEVLCRSSALHATLDGDAMYSTHRARSDYESSDWMILSPRVPVHRTDAGEALDDYWPCDFITAAAPVAHRVGQPRSSQLMAQRIERLLQIAAAYDYETLVLGAWGCGAFGNDARATAASFRSALTGTFDSCFQHVEFAITDWSPERKFLGPFRDEFTERS